MDPFIPYDVFNHIIKFSKMKLLFNLYFTNKI